MTTTIGFIGLGAMGGAMARNLAKKGHDLHVFDLSQAAREAVVAHGATAVEDASAAVRDKDIVFTSLPTPELVESFWMEHIEELGQGSIAVDTSTIDPATSRRVADRIEGTGRAHFVACTVGKTPDHAEDGEIPAFVGGDRGAIEKLGEVLADLANAIFDMGSVEGATVFKLISNLVGMTNLVALAEGLALATSQGITPETFKAALQQTGAWSVQAGMRLDWMSEEDLKPRFGIDLAAKDLRLSADAAARAGVPVPVGSAALQALIQAHRMGHGGDDVASVITTLTPQG